MVRVREVMAKHKVGQSFRVHTHHLLKAGKIDYRKSDEIEV